ncbi:Methyltransferase-like protein 10 [Lobulomyces angularis]|nr:Methyltransferase-like protein 10 [Lobulomyces angularis]
MNIPNEADHWVTLNPSELGKKSYWDNAYHREIDNFEKIGEIGEVWFGEMSVEKMVKFVEKKYFQQKDTAIIDLGCGNGHLLFELGELGYSNLFGVDYSESAIILSKRIQLEKNLPNIKFETMDVLVENINLKNKFELCLDKGTFDAISLATVTDYKTDGCQNNLRPDQQYISSVYNLLVNDGVLLITSCNWTEEELLVKFKTHFTFSDRVKYNTFTFGGVQGQTITTLALKKKNNLS